MKRALVSPRLILACGLFAAPAWGFGQQAPEQRPEVPDAPAPVPEPPLVVPEQALTPAPPLLRNGPTRWVLRGWLQESWESNVLFQLSEPVGPVGQQSDSVSRASVDLARRWLGQRSDLAASVSGTGSLFLDHSDWNQPGFGAAAAAGWRPTRGTNLKAAGSYGYGYARESTALAADGLLLPLVKSQTLDEATSGEFTLTRRTRAFLEAAYRRVTFESPTMDDGSQLKLAGRLERSTGAESTVNGAYTYTRGTNRVSSRTSLPSHLLSLGWAGPLQRGLRFIGSLGIVYLPAWSGYGSDVKPSGEASLVLGLPRTRLEAGYRRSTGEAFGYGRQRVADLARLAWQQKLGRRLQMLSGASYGLSRDPRDPTFRLETVTASAGLSLTFGQGYVLNGGYGYGRRDYRSTPERTPVSSHSLVLGLTRQWDWH